MSKWQVTVMYDGKPETYFDSPPPFDTVEQAAAWAKEEEEWDEGNLGEAAERYTYVIEEVDD